MLETTIQDLRYSLRTLVARPGFTTAVLLTLALAIGANTLVFSLIDAIYLRPLPYRDDATLIDLSNDYAKSGPIHAGVSIPDYLDRREAKTLADSALYTDASVNLTIDDRPVRLHALRATPSLFSTLGVGAALGRTFTDDEALEGRGKVAVLGHTLWQSRFAGDPAIVGRDLRLNDETYRIVGVMPPGFMFPDRDTTLYVPFVFTEKQKVDHERGHEFTSSVARLAPGATFAAVKAECDAIIARNAERIGATGEDGASFRTFVKAAGFTVGVQPLRAQLAGDHADVLFLLQGAVALVLLIACANIANLLLTRLSSRQKELSVRVALGAGRARIARQLVLEALLLAVAGGALGLLVAFGGARIVLASGLLPDWIDATPDARTLGFTLAMSVATGLFFGAMPALSAAGFRPQQVLREAGRLSGGGRGARRTRNALVVAQLALAVMLLASSGLLVRSFAKLIQENPGFRSSDVLTAAISLPEKKYPDRAAWSRAFARIVDDVRKLPGVEAVGVVDGLPFAGYSGASFRIAGRAAEGQVPHGHVLSVGEDYFKAMGIPLERGRAFSRADWDNAAKVVVIDEMFERKHFPKGDALESQLDMGSPSKPDLYTIIGVVGTTKDTDLANEPHEETYYFGFADSQTPTALLAIRGSVPPSALVEPLRATILAFDPNLPLFDVRTMAQRVDGSLTSRRVPLQLIGLFSGLALLLAAVGIYGVLAFAVAQRTGEFGVRMAIGAKANEIERQVLGDGARLVVAGLAIGVAGAIALGFVLKSRLFGVGSIDLPSLAVVALVLTATAMAACWFPARRAARTAPVEALRYE
jgi:putative ABC transport system permease protein